MVNYNSLDVVSGENEKGELALMLVGESEKRELALMLTGES